MTATLSPTLSRKRGESGPRGREREQDGPLPPLPIPRLGAGFGIAFVGRLRSSRCCHLSIAPDYATLSTQYAVAANATFANLDSPAGWNTQSSADIALGTSTLRQAQCERPLSP